MPRHSIKKRFVVKIAGNVLRKIAEHYSTGFYPDRYFCVIVLDNGFVIPRLLLSYQDARANLKRYTGSMIDEDFVHWKSYSISCKDEYSVFMEAIKASGYL